MARTRDPRLLETDDRLAGLFPREEVAAIAADMRANGFRAGEPPIHLWRYADARGRVHRVVAEGHQRREAAILAGLERVPVVEVPELVDAPLDHVVAYAIYQQRRRRNLRDDQLVAFVVDTLLRIEGAGPLHQRQDLYGYSAKEWADICGCSITTIERARRLIRSGDRELLDEVRRGDLNLQAAIRKLAAKMESPDPTPRGRRGARAEPEDEPEPTEAASAEDDADTLVWDLRGDVEALVDRVEESRALSGPARARVRVKVAQQLERLQAAADELGRLFGEQT